MAFTPVAPSDKPLQETSVVAAAVAINPMEGSVNVDVVVVVHPFASVTPTVYVPAVLPLITFAVCPEIGVVVPEPVYHWYVYGLVPPAGVAVMVPFDPPLQEMFTPLKLDNAFVLVNNVGCVRVVPAEPSKSFTHVVLFASRTDT